jgi:uncharacterized iron-regulated membrane protein
VKPQQIVILAFCLLMVVVIAFGVVLYVTRSPGG